MIILNFDEIKFRLKEFADKEVEVWIGVANRATFQTQMSVSGKLESRNDRDFRVYVNKATYTYFHPEDVKEISEIDNIIIIRLSFNNDFYTSFTNI